MAPSEIEEAGISKKLHSLSSLGFQISNLTPISLPPGEHISLFPTFVSPIFSSLVLSARSSSVKIPLFSPWIELGVLFSSSGAYGRALLELGFWSVGTPFSGEWSAGLWWKRNLSLFRRRRVARYFDWRKRGRVLVGSFCWGPNAQFGLQMWWGGQWWPKGRRTLPKRAVMERES